MFIVLFEGVLKEITNTFIEKLEVDIKIKPQNTKECIKVLEIYDRNNLLKSVKTEKRIIIQAKKIRNMFVHEQWMTIKNNVWDFKTRKVLQQLSISDLINAITNMLETIEMIGIENKIYKIKCKKSTFMSRFFTMYCFFETDMIKCNRTKQKLQTIKTRK